MTPAPTLDAALAAYDLTAEDIPGITAAWEATFADLTLPLPESAEAALMRMRSDLASWDDLTIDEVTPRADGTLQVSIDGRRAVDDDEDDEGDDSVPVTLTESEAREFLTARENATEIRRLNALHRRAEQVASGEHPIWWLLSTNPRVPARHAEAHRMVSSATRTLDRITEHMEQIELLQSALDTHTPISDTDAKRFGNAAGYASGVKPLDRTEFTISDDGVVRVTEVNDIARALAKYTPELARLQEALDAAHALPDGALRDYLIGERPQRSYPTTEGTGRRKRTVEKFYTPTSDLVKDHRSAADNHARAERQRTQQTATLQTLRADATVALADAKAKLAVAATAVDQAWAEGWTGAGAPPKPLSGSDARRGAPPF